MSLSARSFVPSITLLAAASVAGACGSPSSGGNDAGTLADGAASPTQLCNLAGSGGTLPVMAAPGTWRTVDSGTTVDLYGISGSSATDVVVVGSRTRRRWDEDHFAGTNVDLNQNGVFVPNSREAFSVGGTNPPDGSGDPPGAAIYRRAAGTWVEAAETPDRQPELRAVWASSGQNAFAVGATAILRFDGSAWATSYSNPSAGTFGGFFGVWGVSDTDIWAVGDKIMRFNGTTWTEMAAGAQGLFFNAVWSSCDRDVWLGGSDGTIRRWNGTAWSSLGVSGLGNIYAIWGTAPNNVWFAGGLEQDTGVTLLHWNGQRMENKAPSGTNGVLRGVWGYDARHVWAVGLGGQVLQYSEGG